MEWIESRAGRRDVDTSLRVEVDANGNGQGSVRYNGTAIRDMQSAAVHLKGVLQALHCTRGVFVLKPLRQTQYRAANRMVVRDGHTDHGDHSFTLKIRPGDNSTCWEYILFVPQDMSAKTLQQQMIGFIKQQNGGKLPVEQDEPMAATNGTERKELDTLDKLPRDWPMPKEPPMVAQKPAATPNELPPEFPLPKNPLTPKPAPASQPPQPAAPTPTQELDGLFGRLRKALERKEAREHSMADLGGAIVELRREIETRMETIKAHETRQLELMQEAEQDTEAAEAQALLATLKKFNALGPAFEQAPQ